MLLVLSATYLVRNPRDLVVMNPYTMYIIKKNNTVPSQNALAEAALSDYTLVAVLQYMHSHFSS